MSNLIKEMEAKELRIGNYIYFPSDSNLLAQVASLGSFGGIEVELLEYEEWLSATQADCEDVIEPIPLTEEWMQRFGFKDVGLKMSGYRWMVSANLLNWRNQLRIAIPKEHDDNKWSVTLETSNPSTWVIAEIKYVHQLQNLYFALTGEELDLKET